MRIWHYSILNESMSNRIKKSTGIMEYFLSQGVVQNVNVTVWKRIIYKAAYKIHIVFSQDLF